MIADEALATLVYAIRDLHCEADGYCAACKYRRWPCDTVQVADELAAEASS